ncbi:MAG: CvpA family protein [Desulfobulbus sp.]|nr:MAG: CvpA family protein [Desulfobulbus sp.]
MIALSDITSFDVIVVLLFLLFLIRGTWIGFMRQLAFFLALIGSYLVAGQYTSQLMPYVGGFIENPKAVFFVSFGLLFLVGGLVLMLLGKILALVMEVSLAGWFDRTLGFLLGLVKGVFVTSFLYMAMSSSMISANELLEKSLTSPYLARGAEVVRTIIADQRLRDLFLAKLPAIINDLAPAIPGDVLPEAPPPAGESRPEAGPPTMEEPGDRG